MKTGDFISAENANWKFSGETVKNFDSHVKKSVPFYSEGHSLVCGVSDFFVKDGSTVYEIGSSTGQLLCELVKHNASKSNANFIGIDIEKDMVLSSNIKKNKLDQSNIEFICDDIAQMDLQKSDLIVAYYTIQFIRPSERQKIIDKLYNSLNWGGALLLFEKVRACDARFQDIAVSLYNDYKIEMGYSPEEIMAKSMSLKGVLEPFSTQGNLDMLNRAGFKDVTSIMKYISFEGFLAIK